MAREMDISSPAAAVPVPLHLTRWIPVNAALIVCYVQFLHSYQHSKCSCLHVAILALVTNNEEPDWAHSQNLAAACMSDCLTADELSCWCVCLG